MKNAIPIALNVIHKIKNSINHSFPFRNKIKLKTVKIITVIDPAIKIIVLLILKFNMLVKIIPPNINLEISLRYLLVSK